MTGIPFDQINKAALAAYPGLLRDMFPAGRLVGREFVIGDIRGNPGDSLSINTTSGKWADFAGTEKGGDPISLFAAAFHRGDAHEAARELGTRLGVYANGHAAPQPTVPEWQPIIPPPPGSAEPDLSGFDVVYTYRGASGEPLFYIRRREAAAERRKQFVPLVFGTLAGKRGWHPKHPLAPRPLYGLDRLATLPGDPLVCEGEKAADAAQRLFPDRPCLSWPGGTNSVSAADWTPLRGRSVVVWPDNDGPGANAAQAVSAALYDLGARVSVLRVDDLLEKADAADVTLEEPETWLADRAGPALAMVEESPPPDLSEAEWQSIQALAATAAAPRTETTHTEFAASPLNWDEMLAVPPREWVYGHFLIRRFISVLGAPGGTGKTAYAFAIAIAVATGIELLNEKVHEPGNVWIYNLEDPKSELLRRIHAAAIHHRISRDLIEGRLFLDSGRDRPLVIAKAERDGTVVASPVVPLVIEEIKRRGVKVMIVDPFVRSHRLEENVNEQIDFAAALWGEVADKADCAILLLHHFKKGGVSGDANAFRGASALIDAARSAISLAPMSADEANKLGVKVRERWQYVRADNAKLNLAPPPEATTWLRLVGEPLGNATGERPDDVVQSVDRWEPPSPFDGLSMRGVIEILEKIEEGPAPGERYTLNRRGNSLRWAGYVIMTHSGKTDAQASDILGTLDKNKMFQKESYTSPSTRQEAQGISVNQQKLADMRSGEATFGDVD